MKKHTAPGLSRKQYPSDGNYDNVVCFYVIYDNPSDYPNKFVVRKWMLDQPVIIPEAVVDTIEQAREHIPTGATIIPNQPNEDPVIKEVYML